MAKVCTDQMMGKEDSGENKFCPREGVVKFQHNKNGSRRRKAGETREFDPGGRWRQTSWELSLEHFPFFPVPYHTSLDPPPIP